MVFAVIGVCADAIEIEIRKRESRISMLHAAAARCHKFGVRTKF